MRREIGEIVRYLPDKKISAASQTVATARLAHKITLRRMGAYSFLFQRFISHACDETAR